MIFQEPRLFKCGDIAFMKGTNRSIKIEAIGSTLKDDVWRPLYYYYDEEVLCSNTADSLYSIKEKIVAT